MQWELRASVLTAVLKHTLRTFFRVLVVYADAARYS
jgi:hypothetical protein